MYLLTINNPCFLDRLQPKRMRYFNNDKGGYQYRGLLLSTCQSVPLFSHCNNLPSLSWRGAQVRRKKLMYKTFYQRPVFRNQWSTFDAFTVMDCSQVGEKWHFFTSQVSTAGDFDEKHLLNIPGPGPMAKTTSGILWIYG